MTDLEGKTALVTGSTSGIGKATAVALAARGAHVLVVGRNEQRAKDVVAEIEGSGGSATFRLTTLSDLESARDLVEWATEAGDVVAVDPQRRGPGHVPDLQAVAAGGAAAERLLVLLIDQHRGVDVG